MQVVTLTKSPPGANYWGNEGAVPLLPGSAQKPSIEGVKRFVNKEPVARVHECVLATLALETERKQRGTIKIAKYWC